MITGEVRDGDAEREAAKRRIERLTAQINYYNEKYFIQDRPEIEDWRYDALLLELEKLEEQYPEFVLANSPTKRVGGEVSAKFGKVTHDVPMQSLMDVFDYDGLYAFDKRVRQVVGDEVEYIVEQKIDGLSVSLEYRNGKFVRGSTRGNGIVGEDVTENLKTIKSIPMTLTSQVDFLEVRGEVFMPSDSFYATNQRQLLLGEPQFANPRNAAAGSLRQLDATITAARNLDIFVFNVQKIEWLNIPTTHEGNLVLLDKLGFKVMPYHKVVTSADEAINAVEEIAKMRNALNFEIDGAVMKVNSLRQRKILGTTSKAPKWAVAYKYQAQRKETVIKDIWINIGRTGLATPNAVFEPVDIAGTVVQKATLHNMDYINVKDIRVGDTVLIQKAGDIIPEVVEVIKERRNGTEKKFEMPQQCPACGTDFIKDDNVAYKCPNMNCKARISRSIEHFVSRDAMNIDGLGEATVGLLLAKGFIKDIADIYYLHSHRRELEELDGLGKKSVDNLLKSIEKSKFNNIDKLIFGLGIGNVGARAAQMLAKAFATVDALSKAKLEDIVKLHEFGEKTAANIVSYFNCTSNLVILEKLRMAGVNLTSKTIKISDKWKGLKFVVTGTLEDYSRNEITDLIVSLGGQVTSAVSKNTNFVVSGKDAGSKIDKALSLGVRIISEKEFKNMLQ